MADISMCPGNNCPKKEECYRYKAVPSESAQWYFVAPLISWLEDRCEFFIPTDKEGNIL